MTKAVLNKLEENEWCSPLISVSANTRFFEIDEGFRVSRDDRKGVPFSARSHGRIGLTRGPL